MMDKSTLEKLISNKANDIYKDKMAELSRVLGDFFNKNKFMNAHEHGDSLSYFLSTLINKKFEERKPEIIRAIEKNELDQILSKLESVKFLFEAELREKLIKL